MMYCFAETQQERIALFQTAVPKLQEFCSNLGLFFELIELQSLVELKQLLPDGIQREEIRTCQRLSLGPSFVVSVLEYARHHQLLFEF